MAKMEGTGGRRKPIPIARITSPAPRPSLYITFKTKNMVVTMRKEIKCSRKEVLKATTKEKIRTVKFR